MTCGGVASDMLLSDCIVRLANTLDHVEQLQQMANELPQYFEWLDAEQAQSLLLHNDLPTTTTDSLSKNASATDSPSSSCSTGVLGALRMFNGCRVIHVPSYLKGLWLSCQRLAASASQPTIIRDNHDDKKNETHKAIKIEWKQLGSENVPTGTATIMAGDNDGGGDNDVVVSNDELTDYDAVVLAAGASIFQDYFHNSCSNNKNKGTTSSTKTLEFPIHLVRGQSIEFVSNNNNHQSSSLLSHKTDEMGNVYHRSHEASQYLPRLSHALLCGKYISPLPPMRIDKNKNNNQKCNGHSETGCKNGHCCDPPLLRHRVLVGATHEYEKEPFPLEEVVQNLRMATEFMVPTLWQETTTTKKRQNNGCVNNNGNVYSETKNNRFGEGSKFEYQINRITSGYRVQTQRGRYGRLPLVGKLSTTMTTTTTTTPLLSSHERWYHERNCCLEHDNVWIYTGLSSRGILYHALFANLLVEAIWTNNEAQLMNKHPELEWWK